MHNIKEYEGMAKLSLSEEEREWVSSCADILLESFQELNKIDTEDVKPLVTVLNMKNVMRDDVTAKHISREELLSNAPEQYDGYFQVPRQLSKGGEK